jgi:hypothetical protein
MNNQEPKYALPLRLRILCAVSRLLLGMVKRIDRALWKAQGLPEDPFGEP